MSFLKKLSKVTAKETSVLLVLTTDMNVDLYFGPFTSEQQAKDSPIHKAAAENSSIKTIAFEPINKAGTDPAELPGLIG